MPVCEICGEDVSEVRECRMCGVLFCQDCGDFEQELCEDCIFETSGEFDEEMDEEDFDFDEEDEDFFDEDEEDW